MNLETKITIALKEAMKSKDKTRLIALRAIKSAIILQKTQKSNSSDLLVEDEMRILQKLVKQRKESADIFLKQDRGDLAEPELGEAKIIQEFLPESLSEDEIIPIVKSIPAIPGRVKVAPKVPSSETIINKLAMSEILAIKLKEP